MIYCHLKSFSVILGQKKPLKSNKNYVDFTDLVQKSGFKLKIKLWTFNRFVYLFIDGDLRA